MHRMSEEVYCTVLVQDFWFTLAARPAATTPRRSGTRAGAAGRPRARWPQAGATSRAAGILF